MSEPMTCGGWSFPTIGCGAPLRAERYGRDPVVDHDTMIRCLDCGTPMCRRCAQEHFKDHKQQLLDAATVGALRDLEDESPADCGWVPTLEGGHVAQKGDWIITGVKGEKYPCKPDIFAATYELVVEG
jgi:hypothetical protein